MQASSESQLFQSDSQLAKSASRSLKAQLHSKTANPIKLASKPLSFFLTESIRPERREKGRDRDRDEGGDGARTEDMSEREEERRRRRTGQPEIWIAESGFLARRVGLESGRSLTIFRSPNTPSTAPTPATTTTTTTTKLQDQRQTQTQEKGHSGPVTCLCLVESAFGKDKFELSSGVRGENDDENDDEETEESGRAQEGLIKEKERLLLTGSWDRTIKAWDIEVASALPLSYPSISPTSPAPAPSLNTTSNTTHSDFLKSLLYLPSSSSNSAQDFSLLLSSSSDKTIRVWDTSSLTPTNGNPEKGNEEDDKGIGKGLRFLKVVRRHNRPVEKLGWIPIPERQKNDKTEAGIKPSGDTVGGAFIISADSMGCLKIWRLTKKTKRVDEADQKGKVEIEVEMTLGHESKPHLTAIWDMIVIPTASSNANNTKDRDETAFNPVIATVWTVSSDNSALLSLLVLPTTIDDGDRGSPVLVPLMRFKHPDFVKSIAVWPPPPTSSSSPLRQELAADDDGDADDEGLNGTYVPTHLVTGSTDENIRVFELSEVDGEEDEDDFIPLSQRVSKSISWIRNFFSKPSSSSVPSSDPTVSTPIDSTTTTGVEPSMLMDLIQEMEWKRNPRRVLEAHWDEVNGLGFCNLLHRNVRSPAQQNNHDRSQSNTVTGEDSNSDPEPYLISSSLDCTIRRWRWRDVLKGEYDEDKVIARKKKDEEGGSNSITTASRGRGRGGMRGATGRGRARGAGAGTGTRATQPRMDESDEQELEALMAETGL